MRRLSSLSLVALLILVAPLTARADDASKRAKIDEMFTILHVDALMQQMTAAALAQAKAGMQSMATGTDPAAQAKANELLTKMFDLINQELSWKALEPEMAQIYSENFTEGQIDDILVFYKSPTGKVMVEKMPQLTTQSMQIAQKRMLDLEPKMKALVDQMMKESPAPTTPKSSSPGAKSKQ